MPDVPGGRMGRPSESMKLSGREIALAALVAGLLAAQGELAIQWARHLRGVAVTELSPDAAWMAPLVSVAAFLLVALILSGTGRFLRPLRRTDVVAFILAFLACANVLTVIPMLHMAAAVLLAAGIAWRIGKWAGRRRPPHAARPLRVAALLLGSLSALIGVTGGAWQKVSEARALAKLPAAAAGMPNVLLLILDTVRGESLSLHGYSRQTTPVLSALARESTVFDRAWAPSPWTLPSHASIFTGYWAHEVSADWRAPLDDSQPVLAEALAGRGYATAGFVANLIYTHRGWGLARGFSRYEDFPVSAGQVVNSFQLGRLVSSLRPLREAIGFHDMLSRKPADELNRSLLRWIDRAGSSRPFFAFVNYFDAHEPLLPPAPWNSRFGPPRSAGPFRYGAYKVHPLRRYAWDAGRIAAERDAYDGAVAWLDHSIGELIEALEQRGILDNTLVIITSDHGEQFGEHRLLAHGNSLYSQLLLVPLLLRLPGRVPAGARVEQGVSLTGIPATVMDLIAAGPGPFPGASLRRFWSAAGRVPDDTLLAEVTGGSSEAEWEPIARGDVRSALIGPWHYIINPDGREELYDVARDPAERNDLAGSPEHEPRLAAMRAALAAARRDGVEQPGAASRVPRRTAAGEEAG